MTCRFMVLILISVSLLSCTRSQFPTTTRQVKHGKVTYANRHPREARLDLVAMKNETNHEISAVTQDQVPAPVAELVRAETGLDRVDGRSLQSHGLLLVSNPGEVTVTDHPVAGEAGANAGVPRAVSTMSAPPCDTTADSTRILAPKRGTTMDLSARYIIHLVNGKNLETGPIFQSHDTLFYQDRNDPYLLRFVEVRKVNTIIRELPGEPEHKSGNGPRNDPLAVLALLFTILGWVPVIGIPFALLALIFGLVSLGKIRRNPGKFKGRDIAIAALILWAAGLIVYIVLAATGTFTVD